MLGNQYRRDPQETKNIAGERVLSLLSFLFCVHVRACVCACMCVCVCVCVCVFTVCFHRDICDAVVAARLQTDESNKVLLRAEEL